MHRGRFSDRLRRLPVRGLAGSAPGPPSWNGLFRRCRADLIEFRGSALRHADGDRLNDFSIGITVREFGPRTVWHGTVTAGRLAHTVRSIRLFRHGEVGEIPIMPGILVGQIPEQ